ncbi:unnamed protein product, partial [Allacma fusca]
DPRTAVVALHLCSHFKVKKSRTHRGSLQSVPMLNLSFFAFASLALTVSVTSGELIPRRILAPRVRRESVRHVRSPIGSNPARPFVRMRGPQEDPTAGYFRKGRAVEACTSKIFEFLK